MNIATHAIRSCLWGVAGIILITALTACGGGSGGASAVVAPAPPTAYTISVTVAGLSGSGLILQLNTANDLAIAANGNFTFASSLAAGTSYGITVETQPVSPAQVCSVIGGSGMAGGNAPAALISCANSNCPTAVSNGIGDSPAPSTPTAFVLGSAVVDTCIIGYPANSSGPVSPTVSITLPALTAYEAFYVGLTADSYGNVYVLSTSGPQDMGGEVLVFAPGANGMATPVRTLVVQGQLTDLPSSIAVDGTGAIYVATTNSILVFAPGADGNAPPIRTIGVSAQDGESFGCGQLAVDASGNIVCGFNELGMIQVFSNALTGNGALARTISIPASASGQEIVGLSLDPAGNIYVAATVELTIGAPVSILEFAGGTNGTGDPVIILTPDTLPGNRNVNSLGFDAAGNLYVYEIQIDDTLEVPVATVLQFTVAANGFASPTTESLAPFLNRATSFAVD
jgi:hypothetical protein